MRFSLDIHTFLASGCHVSCVVLMLLVITWAVTFPVVRLLACRCEPTSTTYVRSGIEYPQYRLRTAAASNTPNEH